MTDFSIKTVYIYLDLQQQSIVRYEELIMIVEKGGENECLLKDVSLGTRGKLHLPTHIDFFLDFKALRIRKAILVYVEKQNRVIVKCFMSLRLIFCTLKNCKKVLLFNLMKLYI